MPDDNDFFKRLLLGEPEPRKKSLLDLVLEVNAAPTPPRSNLATLASLAGTPSALPPISGFGRLIGSPAPVPALPRVPFEVPPNGIRFGETLFSEPATFGGWLPMAPGLYVILTRTFQGEPASLSSALFRHGCGSSRARHDITRKVRRVVEMQ